MAGHICLDVIPAFKQGAASLGELLVPGKLVDVGPAVLATGGAVANTGLALHRLGVHTRLISRTHRARAEGCKSLISNDRGHTLLQCSDEFGRGGGVRGG